jgi:hypothetical protein
MYELSTHIASKQFVPLLSAILSFLIERSDYHKGIELLSINLIGAVEDSY